MDFIEQRQSVILCKGLLGVNEICTQKNLLSVLRWLTIGIARLQASHKYSISPSLRHMVGLQFLDLFNVGRLIFWGGHGSIE